MVDALVYENNRTDEEWVCSITRICHIKLTLSETGPCFEYFLKYDILAVLERLCEPDRPHGIKGGSNCSQGKVLVADCSRRGTARNQQPRRLAV